MSVIYCYLHWEIYRGVSHLISIYLGEAATLEILSDEFQGWARVRYSMSRRDIV